MEVLTLASKMLRGAIKRAASLMTGIRIKRKPIGILPDLAEGCPLASTSNIASTFSGCVSVYIHVTPPPIELPPMIAFLTFSRASNLSTTPTYVALS